LVINRHIGSDDIDLNLNRRYVRHLSDGKLSTNDIDDTDD